MLSALLLTPALGKRRADAPGEPAVPDEPKESGPAPGSRRAKTAAGTGELASLAGTTAVILALPERPAERVEDLELVERALGGESWAREAIFRRYVTPVAAAAQRLLRNPAEVDDVVQETFLIAYEQLERLSQPAALRGWLLQIAISRVHRRFRSWRLWRAPADTAASLEEQATLEATPEQRAELSLVDRALAQLALPLRTAWVLRRVEGHSLEDTAAACDCSLATVKRRIARADEIVLAHREGGRA